MNKSEKKKKILEWKAEEKSRLRSRLLISKDSLQEHFDYIRREFAFGWVCSHSYQLIDQWNEAHGINRSAHLSLYRDLRCNCDLSLINNVRVEDFFEPEKKPHRITNRTKRNLKSNYSDQPRLKISKPWRHSNNEEGGTLLSLAYGKSSILTVRLFSLTMDLDCQRWCKERWVSRYVSRWSIPTSIDTKELKANARADWEKFNFELSDIDSFQVGSIFGQSLTALSQTRTNALQWFFCDDLDGKTRIVFEMETEIQRLKSDRALVFELISSMH